MADQGQQQQQQEEQDGECGETGPVAGYATGYVRQTILQALDLLERENQDMRSLHSKTMTEMEWLRQENDELRKEVEVMRTERTDTEQQLQTLDADNNQLRTQMRRHAEEIRQHTHVEELLRGDQQKFKKAMEEMHTQLLSKEEELTRIMKELHTTTEQLERSNKRNINSSQHDMELLHELEMLKNDKAGLLSKKQDVDKLNNRLRNELRSLEAQLEERALELKNENRRHSLLTKEFNSLLEENSHLKLQLRRRMPVGGLGRENTTSEGITPLSLPGGESTASPRQTPKHVREKSTIGLSTLDLSKLGGRGQRSARSREAGMVLASMSAAAAAAAAAGGGGGDSGTSSSDEVTSVKHHPGSDNSSPDTLPALPGSSKKWRR